MASQSTVLVTHRVSRKERKCDTCPGTIKPGQRYTRIFLPADEDHETPFTIVEHIGHLAGISCCEE